VHTHTQLMVQSMFEPASAFEVKVMTLFVYVRVLQYVTKMAEYAHYGFTLIMITEVVLKITAFGIIGFAKDR